MSIGSISDALSQISAIEGQLQQLESGTLLDSVLGVSGGSSTAASTSTSGTSPTDFSDALAQAQTTPAADTTADSAATASSTDGATALASSASTGALTGSTSTAALTGSTSTAGLTGASSSGVTLPASASTLLTSGQQQFASTLSADTGLNPGVVTSWLLSEESGSAAESRQAAGNNDWLNIGYTGSGTYGATDSVWSDPTTAASATAQWLQGQDSISGYGSASSGIQSILSSVGQTPQAQITALQSSGWSSSGYPDLANLYAQIAG
jgi:hypothetical protein